MNNAFLSRSKRCLEDRRSKLLHLFRGNAQEERSLRNERENDRRERGHGSELEALLAQLTERERRELGQIDAAIRRIVDGSFGDCLECGGSIGMQRLLALPETPFCVSCASQRSLRSAAIG